MFVCEKVVGDIQTQQRNTPAPLCGQMPGCCWVIQLLAPSSNGLAGVGGDLIDLTGARSDGDGDWDCDCACASGDSLAKVIEIAV
jgi:hypothetical protein